MKFSSVAVLFIRCPMFLRGLNFCSVKNNAELQLKGTRVLMQPAYIFQKRLKNLANNELQPTKEQLSFCLKISGIRFITQFIEWHFCTAQTCCRNLFINCKQT